MHRAQLQLWPRDDLAGMPAVRTCRFHWPAWNQAAPLCYIGAAGLLIDCHLQCSPARLLGGCDAQPPHHSDIGVTSAATLTATVAYLSCKAAHIELDAAGSLAGALVAVGDRDDAAVPAGGLEAVVGAQAAARGGPAGR